MQACIKCMQFRSNTPCSTIWMQNMPWVEGPMNSILKMCMNVVVQNTLAIKGDLNLTDFTGLPNPLRRTDTLKAIFQVDTCSALRTRAGGTFIHVCNINTKSCYILQIWKILNWNCVLKNFLRSYWDIIGYASHNILGCFQFYPYKHSNWTILHPAWVCGLFNAHYTHDQCCCVLIVKILQHFHSKK